MRVTACMVQYGSPLRLDPSLLFVDNAIDHVPDLITSHGLRFERFADFAGSTSQRQSPPPAVSPDWSPGTGSSLGSFTPDSMPQMLVPRAVSSRQQGAKSGMKIII